MLVLAVVIAVLVSVINPLCVAALLVSVAKLLVTESNIDTPLV